MRPYICKYLSSKNVNREKYLLSNTLIFLFVGFYGHGYTKIAEQQEGTYEQLAFGSIGSNNWMVLVDE